MAQRFEGKNLEEALDTAAGAFGVERWQLTYHVLMEKRGFLGGVKRLVIEAEINEAAAAPSAPAPAAPAPSGPPRESRGRGGRGRGGARREGRERERGGRRRGGRSHAEELRSGDFEQHFEAVAEEIPEQGPESEAAAAVRAWCEEAIDLARLELAIRTEENETQIVIRLYGRDAKRLIDHHGELLDALQVLANKSLVGRKVEKDIELDCQEFKERRVEEIEQRARELADRVRRDGREQLLPAMSPIERRIVHLALQDDSEVATESRGDGFYKRVALIPRSAAQPPAES